MIPDKHYDYAIILLLVSGSLASVYLYYNGEALISLIERFSKIVLGASLIYILKKSQVKWQK